MNDHHDPVDGALESLGGRQWPGQYDNHKLKDRIVTDLKSKRTPSKFGSRGAIVASLAILILGTAGFAAAGGIGMVRGWFITVEVNGVPIDVDDADIHIEEDGDTVSITLDSANLPVDVEGGEAVITVVASPESDAQVIIGDDQEATTIDISVTESQPPDDEGEDD